VNIKNFLDNRWFAINLIIVLVVAGGYAGNYIFLNETYKSECIAKYNELSTRIEKPGAKFCDKGPAIIEDDEATGCLEGALIDVSQDKFVEECIWWKLPIELEWPESAFFAIFLILAWAIPYNIGAALMLVTRTVKLRRRFIKINLVIDIVVISILAYLLWVVSQIRYYM
jgi:hypothetical protein